jgi:hypothetical protein
MIGGLVDFVVKTYTVSEGNRTLLPEEKRQVRLHVEKKFNGIIHQLSLKDSEAAGKLHEAIAHFNLRTLLNATVLNIPLFRELEIGKRDGINTFLEKQSPVYRNTMVELAIIRLQLAWVKYTNAPKAAIRDMESRCVLADKAVIQIRDHVYDEIVAKMPDLKEIDTRRQEEDILVILAVRQPCS